MFSASILWVNILELNLCSAPQVRRSHLQRGEQLVRRVTSWAWHRSRPLPAPAGPKMGLIITNKDFQSYQSKRRPLNLTEWHLSLRRLFASQVLRQELDVPQLVFSPVTAPTF